MQPDVVLLQFLFSIFMTHMHIFATIFFPLSHKDNNSVLL